VQPTPTEPTPRAEITVIISTLGNYDGLSRVLDRLGGQTLEASRFEVFVVSDAAEPDPSAVDRAVGARPFPVRRLQGGIPGLSANRNAGWRTAQTPLVLFTDNDTLGEPRLLAEHVAWHGRNPDEEVGVVGHVRWAREIKVTPFMHWLDHGMQFDYPNIRETDAGWGRFYGANVSVKRSFVARVGGFDEERLPYLYEDLDFGYRASKHGLRLLYNRNAVVEHLREMDLPFWRSKMGRLAAAERAFVEKHPEIPPYFKHLFEDAARRPAARGLGRRLIKRVPRRTPYLGPRVWTSADLFYRQALAPAFLEAWNVGEGTDSAGPVAPYLLEHEAVKGKR
jgi:GT2 family glycosyltransferase